MWLLKNLSSGWLALALLLAAIVVNAAPRDPAEKAAFRRTHACPATGATKGKCPGYEVDHIVPLCAGGADSPSNMQWLSTGRHKVKTKSERKTCTKRARK